VEFQSDGSVRRPRTTKSIWRSDDLELAIVPDISEDGARASLASWRVAVASPVQRLRRLAETHHCLGAARAPKEVAHPNRQPSEGQHRRNGRRHRKCARSVLRRF
jgi:hypothetical protein